MGIRTGIGLGPEDFRDRPRATRNASISTTPGLIYVIRNQEGCVKIGASDDPLVRLGTLQTGSASPLELVYSAAVKSANAFTLERAVHAALNDYHRSGDWFAVSPAMAIGAIAATSHQLGDPIVEIAKEHLRYAVDRARAEAMVVEQAPPSMSIAKALYFLMIAVLCALGIAGMIMIYSSPPPITAAPSASRQSR